MCKNIISSTTVKSSYKCSRADTYTLRVQHAQKNHPQLPTILKVKILAT